MMAMRNKRLYSVKPVASLPGMCFVNIKFYSGYLKRSEQRCPYADWYRFFFLTNIFIFKLNKTPTLKEMDRLADQLKSPQISSSVGTVVTSGCIETCSPVCSCGVRHKAYSSRGGSGTCIPAKNCWCGSFGSEHTCTGRIQLF